ncbi:MAG: hypothetical protein OCC46_13715 [Pseudodesulfovibrio sp.]
MNITRIHILLALLILSLAGCGAPRSGLQAEQPPVKRSAFSLFADFIEVESLTPTMRWQTIGQVLMEKEAQRVNLVDLSDITYELRIWETETEYSGDLVYSRTGITTPYHTLETSLAPSQKFLWSVRAHFLMDGKKRMSEWGLTGYLLQDEPVPNPACFRFKTPSK